MGFPGGSDGKESACNVGDPGLILGLGRCPRKGNGNPLQYFCLENPIDIEAWWATVHGADIFCWNKVKTSIMLRREYLTLILPDDT